MENNETAKAEEAVETEVTERLVKEVRKAISKQEDMDDDIAMGIILGEAFKLPESETMSISEIKSLVWKTFYRTRSKLNILKPLVEDKEITEIMVNGHKKIFFEKNGRIEKFPLSFDSDSELEEVMQSIAARVHREINELNPIVDARLEDGSRVNGVYKNIAVSGPTLTIRKFSDSHMKLQDLEENGTVSREGAILLKALVKSKYNLFVSGGTSSGKTTLLNALSEYIGEGERVIVIEDSAELRLSSIENLVQMECRRQNMLGKGEVTMARLIKSSLRMRPDRIIVGEVRGEEVLEMLQAMNTGHSGSMSTGHGNSVTGMLKRLETMYLMATPLAVDAVREQIAEGIDVMIHIERLETGRKITEISELLEYRDGSFEINKLLTVDDNGKSMLTGNTMKNVSKLKFAGEKYIHELQNIGIVSP